MVEEEEEEDIGRGGRKGCDSMYASASSYTKQT